MDIGIAIKKLRLERGLNQCDFAEQIGVTQSYLSQIERGHKIPSMELFEHITKLMNLSLPLMFWFCLEPEDIEESKRSAYKMLKPSIDALIKQLV